MDRSRGTSMALALLIAVGLASLPAPVNASDRPKTVKASSKKSQASRVARYRPRGPLWIDTGSPSILYYDFPYYYRRGFYPTHIKTCLSYPCVVYRSHYDAGRRTGFRHPFDH